MNWKITLQQKRFIYFRVTLGLSRILAKAQKLQTVHAFSQIGYRKHLFKTEISICLEQMEKTT